MNEYTAIEQFDTSVLDRTSEDVAEFFSDPAARADAEYADMAYELSRLMDVIEEEGEATHSDSADPRMVRIMELANLLSWFAPGQLDKRFG